MMRIELTREPQGYMVRFVVPALWADAQSLLNIVEDAVLAYMDPDDGNAAVPMQYGDIASVLRHMIEDDDGRTYWRRQELGAVENERLPYGSKSRSPFRLARLETNGDPDVLRRAGGEELDCGERAEAVLFAAWALWLSRVGQVQTIGWSFAGREAKELRRSVGLLARYVPAPAAWRARDNKTFVAGLDSLLRWREEGRQWQECFDWKHFDAANASDGTPGYFPFAFELVTLPLPWRAGRTCFQVTDAGACIDRFDLRLACVRTGAEWRTVFEWDPGCYDEADVSRIAAGYHALLTAAVSAPADHVGTLPVMGAAETTLVRGLTTSAESLQPCQIPRDGGTTVHELFEAQVARSPNAPALTFEGRSLTYRQVNERANIVAEHLVSCGVQAETLVGLCMNRSSDLVIAILAILKAGGAYLPIDLDYPPERVAFMLDDARAPVLLTERQLLGALPVSKTKTICVEDLLEGPGGATPLLNVSSAVTPDNIAYVIYTSGTTGKPKASVITHRNIARLFSSTDHWYQFGDRDVWTLFHSCAFDFSVWEMWGALLYGGRLVVVPYSVSRSPGAFHELVAREQVTVLNQTPSAFRQLLITEEAPRTRPLTLRYVILGGEALEMHSLTPWFERHGDRQPTVVNMYGITETTVHVTYRPVSRDDVDSASVIGVPIPDLELFILDEHGSQVPLGVPGEMYAGGAGVARGYLRRPGLTAERLVPSQFADQPGRRLYRTGDLARWLPSGDIQYLGRCDHQVKIRGFRIELAEIDCVLSQHPAIRQSVVVAREDTPGTTRLVAYAVTRGSTQDVSALRDYLGSKLPHYMVPATFIFLESLPLTNNGKVDRRALPVPEHQRPELAGGYVTPRTLVEQQLEAIWSEALALDHVGVHDGFFELGGHSLLVPPMLMKMRSALGVDVALCHLFARTTIADVAGQVESGLRAGQGHAQTIQQASRTGPLPLSCSQQLLLAAGDPQSGLRAKVATGVRLRGALDLTALNTAYERLTQRHEAFRARLGESLTFVQDGIRERPTLIDLTKVPLQSREAECRRAVEKECWRPIDPRTEAPVRVTLIQCDGEDHVLLVVGVRALCDQASLGVLLRDLSQFYGSVRAGEFDGLSPLPIQFVDYAAWQREALLHRAPEDAADRWLRRMEGAPEPLRLSSPGGWSPEPLRMQWLTSDLPERLAALLKLVSSREGTTLFAPLCAAFHRALSEAFEISEVVTGIRLLGRFPASQTRWIVGPFENTLPFLTTFSPATTFRSLIAEIRDSGSDLYDIQWIPWGIMAGRVYPGTARAVAVPPVVFSFDDEAERPMTLDGLRIEHLVIDDAPADCELVLRAVVSRDAVSLTLGFESSLWTHDRACTMLDRMIELLWVGALDPDRPFSTPAVAAVAAVATVL